MQKITGELAGLAQAAVTDARKLLVDRMSPVKKITLSGQLKRLRKESEERYGS